MDEKLNPFFWNIYNHLFPPLSKIYIDLFNFMIMTYALPPKYTIDPNLTSAWYMLLQRFMYTYNY